jgi:iron complex outermembrane recepter protein
MYQGENMSNYSKPTFGKKVLLTTVGTAMLYLPIQQSFAQLEEIVVTSRRYEESITDAPLAVAVMNNDYLKANRVASIQDVLELTPGSGWGQFAKAQPALGMRGIQGASSGNASLEHAVSVVVDGVPVTKAFMMTVPVYDLQRVEVMRGPQGTTFGRNATLGMMHFISARPNQETSAQIQGTLGERGLFETNGHYNTALSENWSARIAFNYQDLPGSMENEQNGERYEEFKNTSVRASFLYEPDDSFSAYLKAEYIDDEEFPTVRRGTDLGVQWLNGNYGSYVSNEDPWKATLSPDPAGDPWLVTRDMTFLSGELTWSLDNDITVTSITGYMDGGHQSNSDAFGTPYDIRDQQVWNDATIFSQEVRIDNSASGNRLGWLFGASYLQDEEHRIERNESEPFRGNCTSNPATRTACLRNSTLFTDATNNTDAFGIFGEITYDFTDQLSLAVGGRYSNDSRSLDFETYGYGDSRGLGGVGLFNPDPTRDCAQQVLLTPGNCGTPANPVGFDGKVDDSWSNFSPKVSLSYAINENNNIYALWSEGFKAGGFQHDARTQSNLDVILDPETSENFEIGWKGSYDSLVFAVTAFKQSQNDVHQGNLVILGSSQANLLVNAAGIENTGFEFEATWAPTENLTLGGMVALYDPKFKEGSALSAAFDLATGSFSGGEDVSGTIPANSVDESAFLWGSYDWNLSNGSNLNLRADYKYRAAIWARNGAIDRAGLNLKGDGFAYLRPKLGKIGLRFTWTSADENLSLAIWGKNLDNKPDYINSGPGFGYVYLNGPSVNGSVPVRGRPSGSTGRRLVGATATWNFGG